MKKTFFLTIGIGLLLLGTLLSYVALSRLGWRNHGVSPYDFSFLHLNWIFQPSLPFWSAHIANLGILVIGLGGMGVSIIFFVKGLSRVPGSNPI